MKTIDETIHNLTTRLLFYRDNPAVFAQTLAEMGALIREIDQGREQAWTAHHETLKKVSRNG